MDMWINDGKLPNKNKEEGQKLTGGKELNEQ